MNQERERERETRKNATKREKMRTPGGTECETVNETAMKDERAKEQTGREEKAYLCTLKTGKRTAR